MTTGKEVKKIALISPEMYKCAVLVISMSNDFLSGKLDEVLYSDNLELIAKKTEELTYNLKLSQNRTCKCELPISDIEDSSICGKCGDNI